MSNLLRVLIVEDSEDDAQLVLRQLRSGGYDPKWERVDTTEAMTSALHREQWDIILCDYKMPRFSAPAALKLVQETKIDIPFIVVSGTIGEDTAIAMMKSGVHDYLMKDKLARLVVAVEREIREAGTRHEKKKTEEELQRSEQSFKAISENAHDGIIVALRNGAYIYANRRTSEITGYAINEILKTGIEGFAHPDESLKLSERRKKILAGESVPNQYDTVIIHKNGNSVPIEITSARTLWYGQTADIFILRDITERKQAEEALNLKNRMLMSINNYIQAIAFVPQDRLFTTIVTKLKEITGAAEIIINTYDEQKSELVCLQSTLSEERNTWIRKTLGGNLVGYRTSVSKENYEEMMSSAIGRVGSIHEVTFGAIPAPVGKLIEKVFGFGWFVGLALKNNERLEGTIMIVGKPETKQPENEELVAYATAIANVMSRRKAEEALRESEENYRRSLSDSPLGIRIVSADGKTLYANQAILYIYGYDSIEELRTTPHKKIYTPQSYAEHLVRREQRQRGEYVASNYEISIIRKDGEIRHIDVFRKEVLWNGEPQFQVLYNDITERKRAEEALKKSEESYRNLVESNPHGIQEIDTDGKITYANPAYQKMLGYTKEELLGKSIIDLIEPVSERNELRDYLSYLVKEQPLPTTYYQQNRSKDGRIIDMEVGWNYSRDAQGQVVGFTSVITDITERKRAEEALKKSEEYFKEITEHSSDIIIITDKNGDLKYCSRSIERFTGYRPEELIGKSAFNFIHPDDVQRAVSAFGEAILTKDAVSNVFRIVHKDGSECHFDGLGRNLLDNPSVAGFVMNIRDVTERKRAEKTLSESEERFRIATETANDVVYEWDLLHTVLWFGNIDELLGYGPGKFPRTMDAWTDSIHPEDRERVMAAVQAKLDGRAPYAIEYRVRRQDGVNRWWSARGNIMKTPDGNPIKWIGTITDITERKKTEEVLRETEERYESLFNRSLEAIYISDLNGNFTDANPYALKLLGYEKEEIASLNFLSLVDKEYTEAVYKVSEEIFRTGSQKKSLNYKVRKKDGTYAWIETDASLLYKHGKPAGIQGIARDITERKQTEEALKRNEEKFRSIIENSSDQIFMLDKDYKFLFLNKVSADLSMSSVQEMIGKPIFEFFPETTAAQFSKNVKIVFETGKSLLTDEKIIIQGHELYNSSILNPVKDDSGKVIAVAGIVRDITERKKAETLLRESERKYRLLAENVSDVITVMDMNARPTYMSPSITRLLGYSIEEAMSRGIQGGLTPESIKAAAKALSAAITEEQKGGDPEPVTLDLEFIRKDGSTVWVSTSVALIHGPDGRPVEILATLHNISERKQAEDALIKYKDHLEELIEERTTELDKAKIMAEEANKAKSEFLANMSHEIRTPLSSIIGFSELLYDETKGPLNDDQKKYLSYVTSSGQHLLSLINDILDLSKVEAGKMELQPTSFSISDLLKNSFSFIVEKAMKHNIKLLSEISADVDVIEADERKVKQIIYNLLSNAVKFTPDGETITVGADVVSQNSAALPVKIRKGLPDTEYVLVSVKDTGIGIAKKDQSKVFTEFQQIEEPYTKKYEGTGLGLALSQKLVTLHGGKIWFESKGKGKGCTFYFILPLRTLPNP